MLFFVNDYCEGAHPAILQKLLETNMEKLSGYGTDKYCDSAKEKIRKACGCPDAEVFFLVGGTQTNATIIGSVLNRYEGVLAAQTGHVSCHEAGAIEYTGHKVLTLPAENGKIKAESITDYVETFYGDESHDHMVFPGMMNIWCSQAWFIFPIPQSTELFIRRKNWKKFQKYAINTIFRCFWTEQDLAMAWQARKPM